MRKNEIKQLEAVICNSNQTSIITKAKADINKLSTKNKNQFKNKLKR